MYVCMYVCMYTHTHMLRMAILGYPFRVKQASGMVKDRWPRALWPQTQWSSMESGGVSIATYDVR